MTRSRHRIYATLVGFGIWVLLYKTIIMTVDGGLVTFVPIVAALLALEFGLNVGVFLSAVRWWISTTERSSRLALRLTAASVVVHALRVLIYVLGQTGPWHGFDVRPEYRAAHESGWFWVVFSAAMSAISLVVLVIVWRTRRRASAGTGGGSG
jgi:hypothetical protein